MALDDEQEKKLRAELATCQHQLKNTQDELARCRGYGMTLLSTNKGLRCLLIEHGIEVKT